MNKFLYEFKNDLKNFLFTYILVLSFGVVLGLAYLNYTTDYTPEGAITRFRGSEDIVKDEFNIPEYYPKPVSELLITTHNHVIGFSFIFLTLGGIFYFNSVIGGFWKKFLMIEPFISTVVSFSSIWAMRFIHPDFVYLTVISAVLVYITFFVMVVISLYDLKFKKTV